MIKIALFPDSLTHYRVPVFNAIAGIDGVELDVYACLDKGFPALPNGKPSDCRFRIVPNHTFFIRNKPFFQSRVVRTVRSNEYDIVIVWGVCWYLSNWIAGFARRKTGTPLVYWTGGYYGHEKGVKLLIRRLFYKGADAFLLYGNRAKEMMIRYGVERSRIHVIFNSLDTPRQCALYDQIKDEGPVQSVVSLFPGGSGVKNGDLLGLYVGRVQKRKNLFLLLDAVVWIRDELNRNARILICGSGDERKRLETAVRDRGLADFVRVIDGVYDEELLCRLFMAADVSVCPGNIGLMAMHSLTYGTPVVTHSDLNRHGPEAEAIEEGRNGFLFRPNDSRDLASCLIKAADLKRQAPPESIRQVVLERYNLTTQVNVFRELLKGLEVKGRSVSEPI